MTQKIRTPEIITYDNHFNDIRTFNLLDEKSQDLFFAIIATIQKIDSNMHNPMKEKYRLRCKDVCHLAKITNKKKDFDQQKLENLISDINTHVPYIMYISSPQRDNIIDPQKVYLDVSVTAKLQKLFFDIADDVEVTQFKLSSFVAIQSKYAKSIYRLLLEKSNGSDHGIYCAASSELAKRIGTENSDYISQNITKLMRDIASTGDFKEATFGKVHFDDLYSERDFPTNPNKIIINYMWSPERLK